MNNSENEYKKEKQNKARSLYVTLLVGLMAVAVAVAVAGSLAKNTRQSNAKPETLSTEKADESDTDDAFSHKEDSETDGETLPESNKADSTDGTAVTDAGSEAETKKTEDAAAAADVLPVFIAPCSGSVAKSYSGAVPVFSSTMEDWRTHGGVDVYTPMGSDIKAVADGTVSEVWDDAMMGTCVSIEHSGGAVSIYKNLGDELPQWIEKGVAVKAGDVIAVAGESALEEIADESHLHFELKINDAAVNPEEYISFSGTQDYTE